MSHQSQLCSVSVIFISQNHLQHSKCDINLSESKFAHPCESLYLKIHCEHPDPDYTLSDQETLSGRLLMSFQGYCRFFFTFYIINVDVEHGSRSFMFFGRWNQFVQNYLSCLSKDWWGKLSFLSFKEARKQMKGT